MNWPVDCAAVVPCLNEEATIGALVTEVRQHVRTVIIVDDGSSDHTGPVARDAGAEILRHEANRGKGAALQTGLACAVERGFRWAIILDGDGQHSPQDIPAFFHCAEERTVDLVIGNRMEQISQMPPVRRFVNRWMSKRISKAVGKSLPDTQCGFRLIHLPAWSSLSIRTAHFEIESEVLLAFIAAGFRVQFVPIRVIYKKERSKIHPVRDTLRWFRWWVSSQKLRKLARISFLFQRRPGSPTEAHD
jgi:glycosyltransferase involved in cell wall biosynthesis